jgi:glycerol-3-phosphate dehydrogenase subunit B
VSHDAIVIGTGMAGLVAAVRLAQEGARVLVLAKGVGSTHLCPSTIDVLGYGPQQIERPRGALGALVEANPGHPYGLIDTSVLDAAVEWFKAQMAGGPLAPYAYVGTLEENKLLPTAIGAAKPSAVVPETMAAGDLRGGARLHIVGFRKLKDFHSALVADNVSRTDVGGPVQARSAELGLPETGRVDLNSLALARHFDDPAFRSAVVAQIVRRLSAEERVGFPAVLGIKDPHGAWADLEHRLGRPVFEIPTLPPSVPGMRVFATLREALRRAGGEVILNAEVVGPALENGRLVGVRANLGRREVVHPAEHVVLASGGFASGGLELDSRWTARERALGLPVAGVPAPGEPRFTDAYFDEQPLSRAGVAVDRELRPVGAGGEPVYDNVRVAGATLAGAVPWREKSGDGISVATGYRAAELILQTATEAAVTG